MYNAIVILIVVASVLMCLIVLVQESKGGGLASSFADNNSMLGVRKTTDVIEKATWGLAAFMVVMSIISVAFLTEPKASSTIMDQTVEQQATNPTNVPAIEAGAPAEDAAAPAKDAAPAAETPAKK